MEPVQERSVATRVALLNAALSCLAERGYAATTTIEVARRAGVSRGAQQHHFPTKSALLTAAMEHLLDRRLDEFRKAFADLPPGADEGDAAVDLLWSMFDGPTSIVWVELWIAARTDPALAKEMIELERRFDDASLATYNELLPARPGEDPEFHAMVHDFAYMLMSGMALDRLVPYPGQRPPSDYLNALKFIGRALNPSEQA